ncbi:MAG: polysaccharide deacetylase family protein [Chloroflexota bacterium]
MSGTSPFRVALTFDAEHPDRPTPPGVTGRILDGLAAAGVVATFFVQGRWAQAEPALARRIVDDGHLVGSHSHHHARLTTLTGAGIASDTRAAETAIVAATGRDPRPWYRCPFGAGAGSARVVDRLASLGYLDVGWHVDSRDWGGPTPAALRARVVRGTLAHGDGAVVLLHGWPASTAEALPGILGDLRAAGATFATVADLPLLPGRRSTAGGR